MPLFLGLWIHGVPFIIILRVLFLQHPSFPIINRFTLFLPSLILVTYSYSQCFLQICENHKMECSQSFFTFVTWDNEVDRIPITYRVHTNISSTTWEANSACPWKMGSMHPCQCNYSSIKSFLLFPPILLKMHQLFLHATFPL